MKNYILAILVLLLCLFTACQSTKTTANTNNKETTEKTATLDSAALKAHNIGYAYGVVASKQLFSNTEMNMTAAEKDINQFVAGFQRGLEGNQDMATVAVDVLQKRFVEKMSSITPQAAKKIAYFMGINVISRLSTQVMIEKNAVNLEAIKTGFKEAEAGKSKMDSAMTASVLDDFFDAYKRKFDANQQAAEDIGYAYGAVVSQQFFSSEGFGMTKAEKDINQFVAGFQRGLEGNQDMATVAVDVLQKRFVEKIPSATPEEAKQVAYQLGVNVISGLSTQVTIDKDAISLEAIKTGFEEAEAGKSKMNTVAIDSILTAFFEVYKPELEAKQKIQAEAIPNIEAGKAFSAANAKKEGVVTLASGLQYKIIKKGTGKQPTINDKVKTHYHGTTIDGKVFDSSVNRGQPATFGVRQVIRGWQEGIPLMKEGAKYILYIPQELAYGMQSPSADIPAGSTLIFEVELIEVNPKQ